MKHLQLLFTKSYFLVFSFPHKYLSVYDLWNCVQKVYWTVNSWYVASEVAKKFPTKEVFCKTQSFSHKMKFCANLASLKVLLQKEWYFLAAIAFLDPTLTFWVKPRSTRPKTFGRNVFLRENFFLKTFSDPNFIFGKLLETI